MPISADYSHNDDDDNLNGLPAYSHHDRFPPWWVFVRDDNGGNLSGDKKPPLMMIMINHLTQFTRSIWQGFVSASLLMEENQRFIWNIRWEKNQTSGSNVITHELKQPIWQWLFKSMCMKYRNNCFHWLMLQLIMQLHFQISLDSSFKLIFDSLVFWLPVNIQIIFLCSFILTSHWSQSWSLHVFPSYHSFDVPL